MSLIDTFNFVEEILCQCSCDTDSGKFNTGKIFSVPQITSCWINNVD